MSLNRVTSIESYEHARGMSPEREPRKMSFNPVRTTVSQIDQEAPVAAFEVATTKRFLQVVAAVIYCFLAAGPVFGYAALKPVLISEGVYRDKCQAADVTPNRTGALVACYQQELRLNFMFTCAAVATNVCALPVGAILDRYGPRVSGIIGAMFVALGSTLFAFAAQLPFDGYVLGYLFLALGGPFIFISSFQLSNAFPRYSGTILSILTGAFDSSSALFLFFHMLHVRTHGVFSVQRFFLVYLVVPTYIILVELFLMPQRSYQTVGELVKIVEEDESFDVHSSDSDISSDTEREHIQQGRRERRESMASEITSLLGPKAESSRMQKESKKQEKSGVWGALHGQTATQQIWTPWFWLVALFTLVQMTRINYFVATIRRQYTYLLSSAELAVRINTFFDAALPLGGMAAVPFIGYILDYTSTPFVLFVLVSLATLIGGLGLIPHSLAAGYVNVVLFVLFRPFYYTTVSDYAAKVFGFQTFGKVYGLIICLAGLFNFTQSALDALTHRAFHDDPTPVNILLMSVACLIGSLLVSFVWHKSRSMRRELLEEEAEGARDVLMPGADMTSALGYASA